MEDEPLKVWGPEHATPERCVNLSKVAVELKRRVEAADVAKHVRQERPGGDAADIAWAVSLPHIWTKKVQLDGSGVMFGLPAYPFESFLHANISKLRQTLFRKTKNHHLSFRGL